MQVDGAEAVSALRRPMAPPRGEEGRRDERGKVTRCAGGVEAK